MVAMRILGVPADIVLHTAKDLAGEEMVACVVEEIAACIGLVASVSG